MAESRPACCSGGGCEEHKHKLFRQKDRMAMLHVCMHRCLGHFSSELQKCVLSGRDGAFLTFLASPSLPMLKEWFRLRPCIPNGCMPGG